MSAIVDTSPAQRERKLGHHARPVGHREAQLGVRAGVQRRLEQLAPLGVGLALPALQRFAVTALQRAADLLEPGAQVGQPRGQRVGVAQQDVGPQVRVGAGDPRGVAEARAHHGLAELGRLRHERVGHDVRQVRDRGHEPVVQVGVDGLRARSEGDEGSGAGARRAPQRSSASGSDTRWHRRRDRRARARRRRSPRRPAGGRPRSARRRG